MSIAGELELEDDDEVFIESRPTPEVYEFLERSYIYLNDSIFGDMIPPFLITVRKHRYYRGHFHGAQFTHCEDGRVADLIAMNAQDLALP